MSQVSLKNVLKQFGNSRAIDGLDLEIESGEFFVLLGPSGCGKTSTLRCIAGLENPDAGTVSIGGAVVACAERGQFVPPNKRNIGMVFQSYALWPHMSVAKNVAYPLRARKPSDADAGRAIARALDLVGLSGYGDRHPSQLSGGQQQRVALARAVVASPELLLFDEPLSNLDAQLRARLRYDLRRVHQQTRQTAVYVTHDQTEAFALADRVAVMNRGRVEQLGTPSDIFLNPSNRFIAEFVGYDNFLTGTVVSRSADIVKVRPDGWQIEVLARSMRSGSSGCRTQLASRSANIPLMPAGGSGGLDGPAAKGTVLDATYLGNQFQCAVDVSGTTIIGMLGANPQERLNGRPGAGQPISVRFPAQELVELPVNE